MVLFKLRPIHLSFLRSISKIKTRTILQDVESLPETTHKLPKRSKNRVYVFGLAETGALGIQHSLKKHKEKQTHFVQHPSRLSFGENNQVLDVACGYGFSLFAVKEEVDISLYGTGINTDSQVGFHKHGGVTNKPIELLIYPAPIQLPQKNPKEKIQVAKVAAGRAHSLILSDNGSIFALGNNAYGQCGRPVVNDEDYAGSSLIHRMEINAFQDQKIVDIVCGQDISLFLTETGSLYSCGWGADGQSGLGHYDSTSKPTLIQGDISGEKIVKVASSADCVLAVSEKGEVFGWGNSEYGQISVEGEQQVCVPMHLKATKGLGKIVDVAAGGAFCGALNENGDVYVWGFGLLGLGPSAEYTKLPTIIPPTLFGRNTFSPEVKVSSISCGINHFAAINSDQDLFMWGRNKYGCLGLGHQKDQYFPYKASLGAKVLKVSCGADHTIALCKSFM